MLAPIYEPSEASLENNLNNPMEEETPERTLRELYELDIHQRPISIVIPPTTTNFHLRSNLISNLPIFRRSNGEDPHKHLKDFSWTCDLFRPLGGEVPKVFSYEASGMVEISRTKTYQHFFFLIIITRLSQPRKEFKNVEELLKVFKKVEVNLPLLAAIKSIPRYAKFLKELCTHKRRSRSQEKVMVSKNVSSLIKKNIQEKCASIIMPLSVFKDLGLNGLEKISTCIQLADSNEHDLGSDIKDDDEQILKSIGIDNDHDISTHENGIELKVLPSNLKYVFLGENNIYPVTISKELTGGQEARLLETLKRHRQTIGWSLEDIKRIDPSFCTHRIHLEERTKNKVQPQRRLNPTLKEVVKKEVLKLKDVVIIYPILHST
ncbi:integrase [Cucumis melo var. makuwa]|uniref:Integrase n=1 Tax=Cucumis melo var. makuwa TaxID=1194695 RepID=A0A5D3BF34_CUCMM|nr:integrase [Cucumis melo var. makuwa]